MLESKFKTKEYLEEYMKTKPVSSVTKTKYQLDRPELYDYEKEIDKPLYYMNVDEIIELLNRLTNKRYKADGVKISFRTYDVIVSNLRGFFEWYIENVELIRNPCSNKRLKGQNIMSELFDYGWVLTKKEIDDAIQKIRNDRTENTADYFEAIILLHYEGFPTSLDIVNFKETDLNHETHTAFLNGACIHLSDRLYELLVKINAKTEIPFAKGVYLFLSYHNSYFKFTTFRSREDSFQEREPEYHANHLSRILNKDINEYFDIKINARMIYLCGFYDWLVSEIGKEETNRLILSYRSSSDAKKIMDLAQRYGVIEKNVTNIKKGLKPYAMI